MQTSATGVHHRVSTTNTRSRRLPAVFVTPFNSFLNSTTSLLHLCARSSSRAAVSLCAALLMLRAFLWVHPRTQLSVEEEWPLPSFPSSPSSPTISPTHPSECVLHLHQERPGLNASPHPQLLPPHTLTLRVHCTTKLGRNRLDPKEEMRW